MTRPVRPHSLVPLRFYTVRRGSNGAAPISVSDRADWERGVLGARAAVRRAYPAPSEGRFYPKGWEGDAKLPFAEWLKALFSAHRGRAVLTDPYFDLPGLDLVARASGGTDPLVVLTCTQVASEDDAAVQEDRSTRLKTAAERLLPVLRGLNLQLLDLRSCGGGTKPLFHDRYVLLYGTDGTVKKGFNFSTSLQSATRTSPLLITPIPRDILDYVADYVAELLNPEGAEPVAQIVVLFPQPSVRIKARRQGLSVESARSVVRFVEILEDRELASEQDPRVLLRELGYLASEGQTKEKVRIPVINGSLGAVGEFLGCKPVLDAAVVWDGLVQASLAGWHGGIPSPLDFLCSERPAEIAPFLCRYLEAHARGDLRAEDAAEHERTLAHVFSTGFSEAIQHAVALHDHHHEFPIGTNWPIHHALRCTVEYFPKHIDSLVRALVRHGKASDAILSALAKTLATALTRDSVTLREVLLRSETHFCRALCLITEWRRVQGAELAWEQFKTMLSHCSVPNRRVVLARAYSEIRRGTGEYPRTVRENAEALKADVTQSLRSAIEGVSVDELGKLVPSLAGTSHVEYAAAIQAEVIEPLVASKHIEASSSFGIWERILSERREDDHLIPSDVELVQIWGMTYHSALPEQRQSVLECAKQDLHRHQRVLQAPLFSPRSRERRTAATRCTLWWLLRLWAIARQSAVLSLGPDLATHLQTAVTLTKEERLVEAVVGVMQDAVTSALIEIESWRTQ